MSHGHFPRFRYLSLLLVLTLPLTALGALAGVPPADQAADPAAAPAGLSSLPPEAEGSISAALGRDQRAYHAEQPPGGWVDATEDAKLTAGRATNWASPWP